MQGRMLTIKEVAEKLGYSTSWLYHNWPRLREEYNLNVMKMGRGKVKFYPDEINKIIKANIIQ